MSSKYKNRKPGEDEEVVIRKRRFKRIIFFKYNQHLGRSISQYFSLTDFDLSQKNAKSALGETYDVVYQGKSCVLKEMSRALMKNFGVTRHMVYQTTIAKKFKHPFLLKMYAVFEDDVSMYFICERCGESYADIMKRMNKSRKCFSIEQIRRTAAQLLLLIEYFHSKKTILKGIHPANVMMNNDGFIRIKEPGIFTTRKYLYWMPPEHLKNRRFTSKSDLWTFGVFIYWMLTNGNIPYPRIYTIHMLLMKMRLNKIPWPKTTDVKVDPLAKDFVNKLLAFRPKARLRLKKIKSHKFIKDEIETVRTEILKSQSMELAEKDVIERLSELHNNEHLRGDFCIQFKHSIFKNHSKRKSRGFIKEYYDDDDYSIEEEEEEEGEEEEEEEEDNDNNGGCFFTNIRKKFRKKKKFEDEVEEEMFFRRKKKKKKKKRRKMDCNNNNCGNNSNLVSEIRIWKSIAYLL